MDASDSKPRLDGLEKCDVESGSKPDVSAAPTLPAPDPRLEKQLLHKLDWRLAPLFAALYFVAYLDRSNIGNAAVAGLTTSLGLTGSQYSTAVSVFFATYVALEIPIVLAMQRMGPHRAIALMCLGWSVVTIGTAFVKNFGELVTVRVLLGLTEAGFFPCLSLYITMVYKKEEQVR
jgi:MFS family permease